MLDKFSVQDFLPYLNQNFYIRADSSDSTIAELIEVEELGPGPAAQQQTRVPFSIVFRASGDNCLPQQIYQVQHDDVGTLELFLVPLGPDQIGMCYQAVFA